MRKVRATENGAVSNSYKRVSSSGDTSDQRQRRGTRTTGLITYQEITPAPPPPPTPHHPLARSASEPWSCQPAGLGTETGSPR